jgi:hypothetical protein
MFRRVFSTASRIAITGVGGARRGASNAGIGIGVGLLSATAIAMKSNENVQIPSDKDLKKKPSWYQETVKRLENVLRKLRFHIS